MNRKYEKTKAFWDLIFRKRDLINPKVEINNEQIEESIKWLSDNSNRIIEFGCGSARLLLRCLEFNVEEIEGIDISEKAIEVATKTAQKFGGEEKANFIKGGLEKLSMIEENYYDGAILSNIIDNLEPADGKYVLSEISRIVKPGGKVLAKFNPYITNDKCVEYGMVELEEDFYSENDGIYLWNLTDSKLEKILSKYFTIKEKVIVEYHDYNQVNRLYYLMNNVK